MGILRRRSGRNRLHENMKERQADSVQRWNGPTQAKTSVQSHDILYKMSPDILYTLARAQRAREQSRRCHGRRWMSENSG